MYEMFMNGGKYKQISEKMQEMGVQLEHSEISIQSLLSKHNISRKGHASNLDLEIAVS